MEETTRCSVFIPMTNDSLRLNIHCSHLLPKSTLNVKLKINN